MKKKPILLSKYEKWEVVNKYQISNIKYQNEKDRNEKIIKTLLDNRGVKTRKEREEYFNPTPPEKIELKELGISRKLINKAIKRIKMAREKKEKVIIFGDYDVDGICSSGILWEYLYNIGLDITPYIPERFSEGYGIKTESITLLKEKYPKLSLIVAVDNGIIAFEAVEKAKKLGIDVIVIDHHEKGERYPNAHAIIHTTKLCGAGISWVFVRELQRIKCQVSSIKTIEVGLELAALGTIADQMPLIGINRSFVRYGLKELNVSNRVGLRALFEVARIIKGNIGIYEINYMIAPRLNAMGRLDHAIESLRLLCTKNFGRARELAELLNKTNARRQKIVDEVVTPVKLFIDRKKLGEIIILDDESYHEGVIGLVAAKLVEEFFRPAIVISRGKEVSKGSARSVSGFNIIVAIRSASNLILGGGGHEMAAGFSLKTDKIPAFKKALKEYARKSIAPKMLETRAKVDLELKFSELSRSLIKNIRGMEPFGIGNPTPSFITKNCDVVDIRKVGNNGNHLKLKLKKENLVIDAISFSSLNNASDFSPDKKVDVLYNLEENTWNGTTNLQLRVKDVRLSTESMSP